MDQVIDIPLTALRRSPFQPRLRENTKQDVAELIALLKAVGQTTPIVVQRCDEEPGAFWVHQGERRWTAAKHLGWESVKAYVRTDLTGLLARKVALADNLARQNLTAFEKASALHAYQTECGIDLETAATQLGLGRTAAFELRTIWNASDDLKDELAQSCLPTKAAHLLVRLENQTDPKIAVRRAKCFATGSLSLSDLEQFVKDSRREKSGVRPVIARRDVDVKKTPTTYRVNLCWARHAATAESKARILGAVRELFSNMGVTAEEAAHCFT